MAKQFSGFTQEQNEVLARKMGFKGPMDQFPNFLRSDPAHSQKFASYEDKAKQMVASASEKRGFASGGFMEKDNPGTYNYVGDTRAPSTKLPTTTPTTIPTTTPNTTPYQGSTIVGSDGKVVTSLVTPNLTSTGMALTKDMMANPTAHTTPVVVTNASVSDNEIINRESGTVGANPDVPTSTVGTTTTADTPTTTAAPTVETATTAGAVKSATDNMTGVHGTVSQNSQVEAATAQPSDDATVQGQLAKLMTQFDGGTPPAWAAGAMRAASAVMAQRGLSSSSMAAGAITQAAMESAINIAAQDASTFAQFELTNLNNRQQARLQNAQSFLTMDIENLRNDQQTDLFKSQSIIQGLFTDQAAENASRQFNATSQAQTDQFFANLKTQVSQFNAAQKNAMEQFDVGETNKVSMFNRQMNDQRDQFNAGNRLIIDQSNATWRRAVTTANNENANEANRINAQAATGMTMAAYNNLMLREQDAYTFAFQAGENAKQRNHELVMGKMASKDANSNATGQALGRFASNVIDNIFGGE